MSLDQATQNAKDGKLVLHVDYEAFDRLLAACDVYRDALVDLKQDAEQLSTYPLGFAEDKLPSGAKLAETFQQKASGATTSSASSTFESHINRVDEMKALFVALRSAYHSSDRNIANNVKVYGSYSQ